MSASDDDSLLTLRVPRSMAQELVTFASNPVVYISTVISLYIINSVINLGAYIVGSILAAYNMFIGPLDAARIFLVDAFAGVGTQIFVVLYGLQEAAADVVASAGPAGPPLAILLGGALLYLSWELSKRATLGIIQELPGGSTLLGLLGLR